MTSIFEVECICGAKVQMLERAAVCGKCSRVLEVESWQVEYTMTAEGKLVKNSTERTRTETALADSSTEQETSAQAQRNAKVNQT